MSDKLRWGILGTGGIAAKFAGDLPTALTGRLYAVASRTHAPAQAFASQFGAERAFAGYAELLADPQVEAVYIATPHPQHLEWAIAAVRAGKHVLCEKPLSLNGRLAASIFDEARRAGVTFMEAFMYRCHPQTAHLVRLVASGELGRLELIQGAFSFHFPFDAQSRFWSADLAGGGILDVGVYPASMARLLAGAASGLPFAEPTELLAMGRVAPETGVDAHAAALLRFPDGLIAQISCGVGLEQDNTLRVYGSKGYLHVPQAWVPPSTGTYSIHHYRSCHDAPRVITGEVDRRLYAYEADAFGAAVRSGQPEVPAMSWADSLGNFGVLDRWRSALGVRYPGE